MVEIVHEVFHELVGQRQNQKDNRVTVVRLERKNILANALRLRGLVQQTIPFRALQRGWNRSLRKLLELEFHRTPEIPSTTKFPKQPLDRIVKLVHDSFLQRNYGVVRNRYAFRTHLGATLCDVAVADSLGFRKFLHSVFCVERMHLQRRYVHKKTRPDEFLIFVVLPQDVTYVLTQEAFNAFSKFLNTVHILLLHAPASIWSIGGARLEFLDLFLDAKIPGDVGDQIPDRGKAFHGFDRHRTFQWKLVKPGHAHQPRN